jgi:hypothetical protein
MADSSGVAEVLLKCPPQLRELAEALRRLVREAAPNAVERGYKGWGTIGYGKGGTVCAICPQKRWVNLAFGRGADLPDPVGLLEGTGKGMRHVKVLRMGDIDPQAFKRLVQAAFQRAGG